MSNLRFSILGPLTVANDHGPIEVLGKKRRILLIALLAGVNQVVTVDRLTEWLWPAGPPRSAVLVIHTHVSVLRRQLEPDRPRRTAPSTLLTEPPGYVLRANTHQLDSLRFEELVHMGTRLLQLGEAHPAAAVLGEGLGLWRGQAMCGARQLPAAQGEIARLEELRTSATELWIEACLRLDQHDEVMPQLRQLILANPFHERFYAQLMTALIRSGRRAEALSVYQKAQHLLAEELGVKPAPELRKLAAAIVDGDTDPDDRHRPD